MRRYFPGIAWPSHVPLLRMARTRRRLLRMRCGKCFADSMLMLSGSDASLFGFLYAWLTSTCRRA